MRIIEPHAHMASRTHQDYAAMAAAGIEVVIEPAFWQGTNKKHAGSHFDYFEHISNFEPIRAAEYGIQHFCCIGLNPKECQDKAVVDEVIEGMARWLDGPTCVAVGEIGFDQTDKVEEEVFIRQLLLAEERKMPVLIHTSHIDKRPSVERMVQIIDELGVTQQRILIDHNFEDTIELTLGLEVWAGLTVYPWTKLTPERAVNIIEQYGPDRMIVNGAPDWGYSDPLSVPKTAVEMRKRGFSPQKIHQVVWENPYNMFRQSDNFRIEGGPRA